MRLTDQSHSTTEGRLSSLETAFNSKPDAPRDDEVDMSAEAAAEGAEPGGAKGLARAFAIGLVAVAGVFAATTPIKAADRVATPSLLIETGSVYAPRGFSDLCQRRPEFCPAERTAGEVARMAKAMSNLFGEKSLKIDAPELTKARLRTLHEVNTTVNATIRPVTDQGPDRWSFSAVAGDCEEYVLMKRELLASLGWPRTALRITVVRDGAGYHAVLVVSTQQGEFVLDNMVGHITRVEDSPYTFVVAQSAFHPGAWVRINRR